jgi:DNA-binding NarL/FixJ family response regulator
MNGHVVVDTASNGSIGLEMLMGNENKYDMVLSDLQMPVMDGIEVCICIYVYIFVYIRICLCKYIFVCVCIYMAYTSS